MVRRAAILGLAKAGERPPLEDAARNDEQWIVRSAAATALERLDQQKETPGLTPLPQLDQLPWLISWAATVGESVGTGEAARHMLLRAAREGKKSIRLAAIDLLRQVGKPEDIAPLRTALNDADMDIVNATYQALRTISERHDVIIPAAS